jgi:hypothetical protein
MTDQKVRENRLRRAAQRQGLMLQKSRHRDHRAIDYGRYRLVDLFRNAVVAGGHPYDYSWSLDDIEVYLYSDKELRQGQ